MKRRRSVLNQQRHDGCVGQLGAAPLVLLASSMARGIDTGTYSDADEKAPPRGRLTVPPPSFLERNRWF